MAKPLSTLSLSEMNFKLNLCFLLVVIICLSEEVSSQLGSLTGAGPMTAISGTTGSLLNSHTTKLSHNMASLRGGGIIHPDRFGRVMMATNSAASDNKLSSNGLVSRKMKAVNKIRNNYAEETSPSSGAASFGQCKKNPLKVAFDTFMSDLMGNHREQTTESINGCHNDRGGPLMPKILTDLINFAGNLMKADWHQILLGPIKPYVSLIQRFRAWSKQYNDLRKELEEEQRNSGEPDPSSMDPTLNIVLQMTSMEIFKINYVKFDKMLADGRRAKHINDAQQQQKLNDLSQGDNSSSNSFYKSPSLIDSNGQINKSYLDRLLLDEERMDFLLELLTKVIGTLEDDLSSYKKFRNNKDDGQEEVDNQNNSDNFNCLEKFNNEEKMLADRLSPVGQGHSMDNEIASSPECAVAPGAGQPDTSSQFNQAMNRLARIAKNELIEAIKGEVIILAQFYFINSLGFGGYKDNLQEAYMCTIKGRLLGNGFFHLLDNVPGVRQITDNTFNAIQCATSRLIPHDHHGSLDHLHHTNN